MITALLDLTAAISMGITAAIWAISDVYYELRWWAIAPAAASLAMFARVYLDLA